MQAATFAYSVLDAYVFGFALQESSLSFDSTDELAELADTIVQRLPAGQYPHMREAAIQLPASGFDYAGQFAAGLDLILDGLERLDIQGQVGLTDRGHQGSRFGG